MPLQQEVPCEFRECPLGGSTFCVLLHGVRFRIKKGCLRKLHTFGELEASNGKFNRPLMKTRSNVTLLD